MRGALILALALSAPAAQAAEAASRISGGLTVDLGFMLDPIVITAPRTKLAPQRHIDERVNATLRRLLTQRSEVRPEDLGVTNDASRVFGELATLTGHMLRLRYTELGFLLTEGLAGAKDFSLQNDLERVARSAPNPQLRASAMVALGYTKEERFVPLFTQMLREPDLTVRLGALEALVASGSPSAQFAIADAAQTDASMAVRIMAAGAYWKMGNLSGRELLLGFISHEDWYVRAHAVRYLGELGGSDEYRKLMDLLQTEQNPIVRSELTLALMRLGKKK